jgi:hypothetical protein
VHEGFCTVVTCAHSNAEAIKEGAEVEVVDVADIEGDDGGSPFPDPSPVREGSSLLSVLGHHYQLITMYSVAQ